MATRYPRIPARLRLLHKLGTWSHRYARYRLLTMTLSLAILFAVPLLRIARFDAWGGNHYALGRPVDAVEGMAAVLAGISVLYIATFASNFVAGRLFCGWGCPAAQISRFGEGVQLAAKTRTDRFWRYAKGGFFGTALSASFMLWWVSPRVLIDGSPGAVALTLAALAGMVLLTFLHGRYWRWQFCKTACPIGLYYSMVAPQKTHGIVFHTELATCKDCHVCDRICPVGLDPRNLSDLREGIGGLAMDGLPGDNHCLRCGDCVEACEFIFRTEPIENVPLLFDQGIKGSPVRHHDHVSMARPRTTGESHDG